MSTILSLSFALAILASASFLLHAWRQERASYLCGNWSSLACLLLLITLNITDLLHGQSGTAAYLHLAGCVLILGYFASSWKLRSRLLGPVVLPLAALLLGLEIFSDGDGRGKAVAADRLVQLHVGLITIGVACLLLSFAGALLYLIKVRALKGHRSLALSGSLPALERLEHLMAGTFQISWALISLAMIIILIHHSLQSWHLESTVGLIKILWGGMLWILHSWLYLLWLMQRLKPRILARALTLLCAGHLLFMAYLAACPKSKAPAQADVTVQTP